MDKTFKQRLEILPIKNIEHPVGNTKYYVAVHVKSLIAQADEEYQELFDKYSDLNDSYEKEVIRSSKLESQIIDLKSQLQQQALPVVPECVDYEIKYRRNNSYSGIEPSDGLLLMQVFQDLNCNGRMDRSGEEGYWQDGEFYKWMQSSENILVFFKAVTEGYTIEKPQLFYLKHIDMSKADKECDYFAQIRNDRFEHESVQNNTLPGVEVVGVRFTQAEIDSMQIGSYEQIEVAE